MGNFPRKIQLFVDDIAGPSEPDEFGLPSPRHQSCFATMIWLAEAGYLQYINTIRQEALDQASLTHLGFTLLSSLARIPQQNEAGTTHIDLLRQSKKSGSSSQLQSTILQVFEQSLRFR